MERKEIRKVGSLLDEFVRANKLEKGLAEYRLKKAWYELLGTAVGRNTASLYIRNRKLFVSLRSSVVRNELNMIRPQIVRKLNEACGYDLIDDLVLK
ncbi:MAG: DUF721 domain-containing protein [Bacteroidota bacterium]